MIAVWLVKRFRARGRGPCCACIVVRKGPRTRSHITVNVSFVNWIIHMLRPVSEPPLGEISDGTLLSIAAVALDRSY
jgi:hypothetical protein